MGLLIMMFLFSPGIQADVILNLTSLGGSNPGIYYEKRANLQFVTDELALRIRINVTDHLDKLEKFEKSMTFMSNICQAVEKQCSEEVHGVISSSNKTMASSARLKDHIKGFVERKAIHELIVGKGGHYQNLRTDELFKGNYEDWRSQANVVKSIFEVHAEKIVQLYQNIFQLKTEIDFAIEKSKMKDEVFEPPPSRFVYLLTNSTSLKQGVEEYVLDLENLAMGLRIERQIQWEVMTPRRIISHIQQILSEDQLQRFSNLSKYGDIAREMIGLSNINVAYRNSTLIYEISVPLLAADTYDLYRLHPVPVKQDFDNSDNKFAYIRPSNEYIAISKNTNSSFEFSASFFRRCKFSRNTYVCKPDQHMLHLNETKRNSCELALFLNEPLPELLDICDVMVISFDGIYLSELEVPRFWIFSSAISKILNITCPGSKQVLHIELSGTGILQMNTEGTAVYRGSTSSKEIQSYISNFTLNLTKITVMDLASVEFPRLHTPLNANGLESKGVLLNEVLRRRNEITRLISPIVNEFWYFTCVMCVVGFFGLLLLNQIIFRITGLREKCGTSHQLRGDPTSVPDSP